MGSFNSAPKIHNIDSQDDAVKIPNGLSLADFIYHCKMMRGENRPQLLSRVFLKTPEAPSLTNDVTDGLRVLNLDTVSHTCSAPGSTTDIRLLQWNILSQCEWLLSLSKDKQLINLLFLSYSPRPVQRWLRCLSTRSSHLGVPQVSDPPGDRPSQSRRRLPARGGSL